MRASRGLALAVVLLALAGGVRCAYAPNPKSGTLMCATETDSKGVRLCPDGYTCDGTFCIKNGEQDASAAGSAGQTGTSGAGGKAGAGTAGAGGMSGTAGATGIPCSGTCMFQITGTLTKTPVGTVTTSPGRFVGHWIFDAGSKNAVSCSDGSTKDNDLATDYVDVILNGAGAGITSTYFCDWNENIGTAGLEATIRPGQSCTRNMTDPKSGTTKFTWHGTTFTFTTKALDANAASLTSTIAVDFVDDASKTGCTPP
jgi:hypothetical protein